MKQKILITEEMLTLEDHFEFVEGMPGSTPARFSSSNHADTGFGQANENVSGAIGSVLGGFIGQSDSGKKTGAETGGKIGDFIGGIFSGGKKEDTSLTGWNKFLSSFQGLPYYPTKDEMLQAASVGKWDPAEPAAIQASYDPSTGRWVRGDWRFQVVGNAPITVTDFKGASETHTFSAPVNAKGTGAILNAANAAAGMASGYTVPLTTQPSSAVQQPSPQLTPTQQAIVAGLGIVSDLQARQALAQAGVPAQPNQNIYAASAGGFSQGLFGGMSSNMTAGIILTVLALVALMIYFANR